MAIKSYAWACDLEKGGGEGDLALAYASMLRLNDPIGHLTIISPRVWILYRNNKCRIHERKKLLSKNQDFRQSFSSKYLSPFIGIFFLWKKTQSAKKNNLIFINYLPLWNFMIFLLLPAHCQLGPISGAPYKDFMSYSIFQIFIRKYIFPILFYLSIKIIAIRFKKILIANPMISYLFVKNKKIRVYNDFFSASTMLQTPKKIPRAKEKFDIIFYYRKHQSKFPDLTLKIIEALAKKNYKIAVFGDQVTINGIKNFGYQNKIKFLSIMKAAKSIFLLGNNYFTLTYFQALLSGIIPFVFMDNFFKHNILNIVPNKFFFKSLDVELIVKFIDENFKNNPKRRPVNKKIITNLKKKIQYDFKRYISK